VNELNLWRREDVHNSSLPDQETEPYLAQKAAKRPTIRDCQGPEGVSRIKKLIEHTASANRVKIDRLSARYGIAEGYCHSYDSQTYIFYSPKIGVQNWYVHEGNCGTCDLEDQCKETLRTLAEEWEIGIPPNMSPTELAVYLVETIRRRLKWDKM
jgi:hypothetical protein